MNATYRLLTNTGHLVIDIAGIFYPNGNPQVAHWGSRTFVFHEVRLEAGLPIYVYREAFAVQLSS